jgi:hypothetical protein
VWRRWIKVTISAVTGLLLATGGCSATYKEGPPLRVCGQEYGNPLSWHLRDVPRRGPLELTALLRLAPGCAHGADVTIAPPTAASATTVISAGDGKPLVVLIHPVGPIGPHSGAVTVSQGTTVIATLSVSYVTHGCDSDGCR